MPFTVRVAEPMGSHLLLTGRSADGDAARRRAARDHGDQARRPRSASCLDPDPRRLAWTAGRPDTRLESRQHDCPDRTRRPRRALPAPSSPRNDRGGYTVPNEQRLPVPVELGLRPSSPWASPTYDADRAWRELETLFVGQWDDGMVPSIVFHQPRRRLLSRPRRLGHDAMTPPTTGISQPPVAATAARVVLEAQDDAAGQARATALFPALFACAPLVARDRDPDGTGLVTVVHPWETGRDNSPDWDAPLAGVTPTRRRGRAAQGQDARQRLRAARPTISTTA